MPRPQGWVWPAIAAVLAGANRPMKAGAIYERVEQREDGPVSRSTIKNELRRQLGIPGSGLQQDDNGGYSLETKM